ncbi:unnamed protein product [Parnassius apollo]|uniref:(apollo) hypothetical protein n=1 Tax=Parnassius apollo TaxID=110799 RepID=A0A8S3W142_PARAO|nr:unnamed protein product [Parnassius apollo]
MDRCYRGRRMVQLSLQQNESLVGESSSGTALDEKTGELSNVAGGILPSPSSTDSNNCSLDFSKSEFDYVPSEDSDMTFCEDNMSGGEELLLYPATGLFTTAQNGGGRAKKRRSRGQDDRSQWKWQKNAEAKLKGEAYTGFKKGERGKYVQIACKSAKSATLSKSSSFGNLL